MRLALTLKILPFLNLLNRQITTLSFIHFHCLCYYLERVCEDYTVLYRPHDGYGVH